MRTINYFKQHFIEQKLNSTSKQYYSQQYYDNEVEKSAVFVQKGQTTGPFVRRPGVFGTQYPASVLHGLRQLLSDAWRAVQARRPVQDGVVVVEPQPADRWPGRHPTASRQAVPAAGRPLLVGPIPQPADRPIGHAARVPEPVHVVLAPQPVCQPVRRGPDQPAA